MLFALQAWDGALLLWIMRVFSTPLLDTFFPDFTALGDKGLVWIAMAIVMILMGNKKHPWRETGVLTVVGLGLNALVCNVILKPLFARPRPYTVYGFEPLISYMGDFSFPSGHTSAAFAAAAVLYGRNQKWGRIAYGFAVLMGFSRLYVGVHYPTDVFFGMLVGIGAGKAVLWMTQWYQEKRTQR